MKPEFSENANDFMLFAFGRLILAISKLMNSDKIKYQTALALQKMTEDPEAIIIELKYHFAWSVQGRRGIFRDLDKYSGIMSEVLATAAMPSVSTPHSFFVSGEAIAADVRIDDTDNFMHILVGLGGLC